MQSTKFKVMVNDAKEFEFTSEQAYNLDLFKKSEREFHVLQEHRAYHPEMIEQDFDQRHFSVRIGTNIYRIEIKNELDHLIEKMGYGDSGSKRMDLIKAPMPGVILETRVKEGQKVSEGEVLLILEAMKMENTILCPRAAVIKKVHIQGGMTVDKNKLLIELE